jgi:hypothetical protein
LSPHHLQHDANWKKFKDEFNLDEKKVEKYFIDKYANKIGASEFEWEDQNYVRNLKLKYKPTENITAVQQKLYENFCRALDANHFQLGYHGDKAFVEAYSLKYGLLPNQRNSQLMAFEPNK